MLGIVFLAVYKACSKRRILHVPNEFKTIDNQLKWLISIVLNAFGAYKIRRLEQALHLIFC